MSEALQIILVVAIYILGIIAYIIHYWQGMERYGAEPATFSGRYIAGAWGFNLIPIWFLFLLWTVPPLLYIGWHQMNEHPFWENGTAQICKDAGGTWYNKHGQFVYNTCATNINNSAYKNTPLDFGNTMVNANTQDTIGYCQCAPNYCWDETKTSCVPGSVIPTR